MTVFKTLCYMGGGGVIVEGVFSCFSPVAWIVNIGIKTEIVAYMYVLI